MTSIYIAGASSRARTTKEYLEKLNPDMKVLAYLVSPEMDDNPDEADGLFVVPISNESHVDTSVKVYLGTRGVNHDKLTSELLGIGFSADNIIPVTPELDMKLRNEYVRKAFEKKGKEFIKLDDLSDGRDASGSIYSSSVHLFIAKTVFDSDFEKPVPLRSYEYIIQAGTTPAGTGLSDASYYDNEGEGISDKNSRFCELTAMYWIWKNFTDEIVGLEHWRRRFLLPDNWLNVMQSEKIDVILPVPLCVMPSLKENFVTRHLPVFWDETMKIIGRLYPEDLAKAEKYFDDTNLYSPCNMLITRKEIFDDYSSWLFPILLELNEHIGVVEDKYQNRYPGFVSERLLNFYFEVRRSDLKIAYADKSFLK